MVQRAASGSWLRRQSMPVRRWFVVIGGLGALACVWALWPLSSTSWTVHAQEEVGNPFHGDPEAIKEGLRLFQRLCIYCHGTGARGAEAPNLTDDYWRWGGSDTDIFATITAGRPNTGMGAFGGRLNALEIWKLIAYIRSQYRGKRGPDGAR